MSISGPRAAPRAGRRLPRRRATSGPTPRILGEPPRGGGTRERKGTGRGGAASFGSGRRAPLDAVHHPQPSAALPQGRGKAPPRDGGVSGGSRRHVAGAVGRRGGYFPLLGEELDRGRRIPPPSRAPPPDGEVVHVRSRRRQASRPSMGGEWWASELLTRVEAVELRQPASSSAGRTRGRSRRRDVGGAEIRRSNSSIESKPDFEPRAAKPGGPDVGGDEGRRRGPLLEGVISSRWRRVEPEDRAGRPRRCLPIVASFSRKAPRRCRGSRR